MHAFAVRLAWFAGAALLAIPATGSAASQRYTVDVARSRVDFRIRYLGLFNPGGQFHGVTGTVVFDPLHWETLEVLIQIPVDSLESGPSLWRSELIGPRFFDGDRYPTIEFGSTRTERTAYATADIWGNLKLRSVTRPVLLKARIVPEADAAAVAVEAETLLQRSAFGLGAVLPFASDDVTIILHLRIVPISDAH